MQRSLARDQRHAELDVASGLPDVITTIEKRSDNERNIPFQVLDYVLVSRSAVFPNSGPGYMKQRKRKIWLDRKCRNN